MTNEHHTAPFCMQPRINIFSAILAAITERVKIVMLGYPLPTSGNILQVAEEIAMLNSLTRGTLHLGIGRGTAKMEYDAYNVDMNEARARFDECFRIVEKGLAGAPFTHAGRFWTIDKPIESTLIAC